MVYLWSDSESVKLSTIIGIEKPFFGNNESSKRIVRIVTHCPFKVFQIAFRLTYKVI